MGVTTVMMAATGKWNSMVTGSQLNYTASAPTGTAAKDGSGKAMTIVYLENLGFSKIGQNSNADDLKMLEDLKKRIVEQDNTDKE